jgi:hypothetical protein
MARQTVRRGNAANDHDNADSIYAAVGKINDNFEDLYALQSQTVNAGDVRFQPGLTTEARIQLAIDQAVAELADRVFVPADMLPYDTTLITFAANVRMVWEGGDWTVYDVRAYGADPDGIIDAGPAWNAARAAVPSSGGQVRVTNGAYNLATAFSFGGQSNVRVILDAGVELTGSALPAALSVSNNALIDFRNGLSVIGGGITVATYDPTGNAVIAGQRLNNVTDAVILLKMAAYGQSAAFPTTAQVGSMGFETEGDWSTDTATAAFMQVVAPGSTTVTTILRFTGSAILPKFDKVMSLGNLVDDGLTGNTYGRRFNLIYCYTLAAVGVSEAPTMKGLYIGTGSVAPVTNSPLLAIEGHGWDGSAYRAGAQIQINAAENWSPTALGTRINLLLCSIGGTSLTTRWVWTGDVYRGATDNVQEIGTTGIRLKTIYGYVANFTTSVTSPILQSGSATDLLLKYNVTTKITVGTSAVTFASDIAVATDTYLLGTSGGGFRRICIEHGASRADGLGLVQTLTGADSPRLFFTNSTDAWGYAIRGQSSQLVFATGATAFSGSGTSRMLMSTTVWGPVSDNAMTNGSTGVRFSTVYGYTGDFTTQVLIASTKVLGARVTGYVAFTGTNTNRGTAYDTATITLPQLAERVRALQVDLTAHGLIGV